VRAVAVDAGVEVELFAAARPRLPHQPREEFLTEALRMEFRRRDEVVDVQIFSPRQTFGEAIAGYGLHDAAIGEEGNLILLTALSVHAREEFGFVEVRTEFLHNRKAAA